MKNLDKSSIASLNSIIELQYVKNSNRMDDLSIELDDFKQDITLILLERGVDITDPCESLVEKFIKYYVMDKTRENKRNSFSEV